MAEISKIIVPGGDTYDIKDSTARDSIKLADWNVTDDTDMAYIKNKPDLSELDLASTLALTVSSQQETIESQEIVIADMLTILNTNDIITGLKQIPGFSTDVDYNADDLVIYDGSLYRFTSSKLAGLWSDGAVTHTSLYEELARLRGIDLYEHVIVTLTFNGTPSNSQYSAPTGDDLIDVFNSIQVTVENEEDLLTKQIIDYNGSKALEMTVKRDASYFLVFPQVDGFYQPNSRSFNAVMTDRKVNIVYTAVVINDYSSIANGGVGLFIVDVDGVAWDPEDWSLSNRDRAVAILVKTQTLIDNNACYYFKIDDFLTRKSMGWFPQNVDFPALLYRNSSVAQGGSDFGASYGDRVGAIYPEDAPLRTGRPSSLTDYIVYYANYLCNEYVNSGGVSGYNLGTSKLTDRCAAAYCRYSSWTDLNTYTLRTFDPNDGAGARVGYLGTSGQWYELWLLRDNFNKLWIKLTGELSVLLGYNWWTSTQCSAIYSLYLGSSGLYSTSLGIGGKTYSFCIVPTFDL